MAQILVTTKVNFDFHRNSKRNNKARLKNRLMDKLHGEITCSESRQL